MQVSSSAIWQAASKYMRGTLLGSTKYQLHFQSFSIFVALKRSIALRSEMIMQLILSRGNALTPCTVVECMWMMWMANMAQGRSAKGLASAES